MVEVRTFSNPVNDVVYISLNHKMGEGFTVKLISKAEIIALQGVTVLTREFEKQEEIRIDFPFEFRVVYVIKITDSESVN